MSIFDTSQREILTLIAHHLEKNSAVAGFQVVDNETLVLNHDGKDVAVQFHEDDKDTLTATLLPREGVAADNPPSVSIKTGESYFTLGDQIATKLLDKDTVSKWA